MLEDFQWKKIVLNRKLYKYFVRLICRFWFKVTFGDEVTKVQKYYVILVYVLQGKMEETERKSRN